MGYLEFLVCPKISKLFFWKKFSIHPINSEDWFKLSPKCDLDSARCSVNYNINGVLKQTRYFENCSRGLLLVRQTRAQGCGELWPPQTGPVPACRYRTACLYGPAGRCGGSRDHLRPFLHRFLYSAFTTVQGLEFK